MNLDALRRMLNPLMLRIKHLVGRGVVQLVDDAPQEQVVQLTLLADETLDGVEHPQPYGFSAHPHPGAEAYSVFAGGNRAHGLVLVVGDRRYRVKPLAQGEVAIYDDLGQKVVLHRDRIQVTSPTLVQVTAPTVRVQGNLEVTGTATVDGDLRTRAELLDHYALPEEGSLQDFRDAYNVHVHGENGSSGPTDPPVPQI